MFASISLRRVLFASMLACAVVPAVIVGGTLWRGSQSSTNELADAVLTKVADRVQAESESFFEQAASIMNGMIPPETGPVRFEQVRRWMTSPDDFEQAAFSLTRQSRDAPSIYFALPDSTFYGVKYDPGGSRISLKSATQTSRTYYNAQRPGDRSVRMPPDGKPYDPRERPWYKLAFAARDRVFTDVYASASTGELIVTLAQPVVTAQNDIEAVFAVDLFLQRFTEGLRARKVSANGVAFVLDDTGALVATSTRDDLTLKRGDKIVRAKPTDAANPVLRAAHLEVLRARAQGDASASSMQLSTSHAQGAGERLVVVQRPFGEQYGLRWVMVVAAPESDFTASVQAALQQSLILLAGVLAAGATIAWIFVSRLSRRLKMLSASAQELGAGVVPPSQIQTRLIEVRELSQVMHDSGRRLADYSEQVKADALAVQAANDSLEVRVKERTAELEASREEALEAAKAKSAFLATMSHEIRTPLNGVVGMSTLLAETRLDNDQRDFLQTIRLSSDQLLGVINDILDFSKIESGKMEFEAEPLGLRDVVEEACDITAPRAREKGLELIIDVPHDTARLPQGIKGDVTRIRQVLINLINNAIKFTEEGEVAIQVLQTGTTPEGLAEIRFTVKDSGIGIPPDRVGRLFQSFSQVDSSTTRKYGGTGLGLAICKRLTELMGGHIGVESIYGEGSQFWFTVVAEPATGISVHVERSTTDWDQRRVLIVDDNRTNIAILKRQLEMWGLQVWACEGGQAALALLREQGSPDLVISDMHMPDMDGIMLAQAIKADARFKALPVVLLSSGVLPANDVNAKLFSARLLKPARQSQLFDTVARALDMPHAQVAPVSTLGERKHLRILVADDNNVNLKVACAMLTRLGYDSVTANDGVEALGAALAVHGEGQGFAAILMDLNMPNMDGLRATMEIRTTLGDAAPPIIALTAAASADDRARCLESGMIDYITKPLQLAALATVLEQHALQDRRFDWPPALAVVDKTAEPVQASAPREVPKSAQPEPAADAPAEPSGCTNVMDFTRLGEFREFDDDALTITKSVTDAYLADAPVRLADLLRDVAAGDLEAISKSAHALKGASSNVGAFALQGIAAQLEHDAKEGVPPGDPAHISTQLRNTWTLTEAQLRAWLQTPAG